MFCGVALLLLPLAVPGATPGNQGRRRLELAEVHIRVGADAPRVFLHLPLDLDGVRAAANAITDHHLDHAVVRIRAETLPLPRDPR